VQPRPVPHSEESAGGVLWRLSPTGQASPAGPSRRIDLEICLIATRGATRWQLPKGHVSGEETLAEAARREVREETGCDGTIEDDLGVIVFWFYVGAGPRRKRVKKTVQFYLVRYESGDTSAHDGEVDEAAWLTPEIALKRLTFESERQILVKGLTRLRGRLLAEASGGATSA
jgi:8-oxo-dGTP pyrophosphatase MutT (NUDIX family)